MKSLASMRWGEGANLAASGGPGSPATSRTSSHFKWPPLPSDRPPPELTSPAVVVAVLAEDAALGVGDRWRVTNAMPAGRWTIHRPANRPGER